ncbi:MAG: sugar phosphate isomerase/epimerase [Thermoprotei archaeon]|nr:MAG: sugar phosphate isomerase/epimerase [Thermoprotei archaeon]
MAKIKIGVQLFSVREDCARDLPGTLRAIAEMGYEGVEFAGYYGRSAGELRDMLRDLGLEVAGSHLGVDTLMGDKLEETIRFNKELGNKYLIVPWLPEEMRNSREAWLKTARFFNRVAERLKREGMYVGYHNHVEEFKKFDGEMGWDIFAGATTPDVVLQIDVGNAMHAGLSMDDVLGLIRRYPGRIKTIHLKEYSRTDPNAILGEGEVRWRELIELCQKIGGTEWYIVEQETYRYPPLECIRRCLENLRKILETL